MTKEKIEPMLKARHKSMNRVVRVQKHAFHDLWIDKDGNHYTEKALYFIKTKNKINENTNSM